MHTSARAFAPDEPCARGSCRLPVILLDSHLQRYVDPSRQQVAHALGDARQQLGTPNLAVIVGQVGVH